MTSHVAGQGVTYDDGEGFYTKAGNLVSNAYKNMEPVILKILEETRCDGGPFVICDYGTADGGQSLALFNKYIGWLKKKYGNDQQIHVVYEDQPTNNFNTLFRRVNGLLDDSPSYYLNHTGVFVSAIGTSFYKQCLPDNSVHLGFSSTAFHWLSKKPCNLSRSLIVHTHNVDAEERRLFTEQAAKDWSSILVLRARELAPGGTLVIVNPVRYPEGSRAGRLLIRQTGDSVWLDMKGDGIITQEEYTRTCMSAYTRTEEEFSAPFIDEKSAVYQAGLRLVSVQCFQTEDPLNNTLIEKEQNGENSLGKNYAEYFVKMIKSYSYHSLLDGLDRCRGELKRKEIVNTYYSRYEAIVAENPTRYKADLLHAVIHARKIREQ